MFVSSIVKSNKKHRKQFEAAIGGSVGHRPMDSIDRMYQSQTLWEEYMAESAYNFITANPASTLIVIAGVGHVIGRVGLPDRISRRTGQAPFVIVPLEVDWLESGLPDIESPLTSEDCDWAWYTEKEIINVYPSAYKDVTA